MRHKNSFAASACSTVGDALASAARRARAALRRRLLDELDSRARRAARAARLLRAAAALQCAARAAGAGRPCRGARLRRAAASGAARRPACRAPGRRPRDSPWSCSTTCRRGSGGPRRRRSRIAGTRRRTLPRLLQEKFSLASDRQAGRGDPRRSGGLRSPRWIARPGCSATRPPRPRTGRASPNACGHAWGATPCAALPRTPIIVPSTRGDASSRASGIRTNTAQPGPRPLWLLEAKKNERRGLHDARRS